MEHFFSWKTCIGYRGSCKELGWILCRWICERYVLSRVRESSGESNRRM